MRIELEMTPEEALAFMEGLMNNAGIRRTVREAISQARSELR